MFLFYFIVKAGICRAKGTVGVISLKRDKSTVTY